MDFLSSELGPIFSWVAPKPDWQPLKRLDHSLDHVPSFQWPRRTWGWNHPWDFFVEPQGALWRKWWVFKKLKSRDARLSSEHISLEIIHTEEEGEWHEQIWQKWAWAACSLCYDPNKTKAWNQLNPLFDRPFHLETILSSSFPKKRLGSNKWAVIAADSSKVPMVLKNQPSRVRSELLSKLSCSFQARMKMKTARTLSVACAKHAAGQKADQITFTLHIILISSLVKSIFTVIWMFPKIMVPTNHPILIGFSIIFTIHFGDTPIFGNSHM